MKQTQKTIQDYLKKRNWDKNPVTNLTKSIIIEAAELLEIFQWDNPSNQALLKDKNRLDEVKGELADVFIYAFGAAISLGLDAEKIVLDKLKKVEEKYPVELVKGVDRQSYLKIKNKHRSIRYAK